MRNASLVSALVGSTVIVVSLSSSASAATNAEIAESLLKTATGALGIEITDPELIEELSDGLEFAIEDGSIPEEITDPIDDAIDSDTDPVDLEDALESNIIDQIANWEEYAPEYRVAFEEVRVDFQACRSSSGSASGCARGVGFKMQVAAANDALYRLQQLEEQLAADGIVLSDEDRAALEAERAELLAKIQRAEEKLARLESTDPAVMKAKNDMARIRRATDDITGGAVAPAQVGSGQSSKNGNSSNAGSGGNSVGNGNSGGSGNAGSGGNSSGNGKGKGK